MYDVAIIGAGMAGMATAARLQAQGLATIVLEAHGQPGGCAGFYRRQGYAFDVGATTLVDFMPGGVGGELLTSIGIAPLPMEELEAYVAWLPDRQVRLYRDRAAWAEERLKQLGATAAHRAFWALLDRLAEGFWAASRRGIKLPIQHPRDVWQDLLALGLGQCPLARYLRWTLGDALAAYGLQDDRPLTGLLAMLVEDTTHSTPGQTPLINAALGITIRGAGLCRPLGGMRGFWQRFRAHYQSMGGELRVGCAAERVTGQAGSFVVHTRRGDFLAAQVVSAVPAALAAQIAPAGVAAALRPYLRRDANAQGGALMVCLGVPEAQVADQPFTHHQLLQQYDTPLGNGNNMFISISAAGDGESAPAGQRAVMISTHCDLAPWQGLTAEAYQRQKRAIGTKLLAFARQVYPDLGRGAPVCEIATPATYARFIHRPGGAVGGVRQTLANANQCAIPHDIGVPGFWLAGDTTWPGLGTVACVLGSRIIVAGVLRHMHAKHRVIPVRSQGEVYANARSQ